MLQRLGALEQTVAQLVRNSEYLMERGQLPLTTNKLGDLFAKFTDATVPDRDRLQALRLLRRSGGITEEALSHAINSVARIQPTPIHVTKFFPRSKVLPIRSCATRCWLLP